MSVFSTGLIGILIIVGYFLGGLLILGVFVLIGNGLITVGNAIIQGPRRIFNITLILTGDTVKRYTSLSGNTVHIDVPNVIAMLFKKQTGVSSKDIQNAAKKKRLVLIIMEHAPSSANEAFQIAANALARQGFPIKKLKSLRGYAVQCDDYSSDRQAYLVAIGKFPTPPPFSLGIGFDG